MNIFSVNTKIISQKNIEFSKSPKPNFRQKFYHFPSTFFFVTQLFFLIDTCSICFPKHLSTSKNFLLFKKKLLLHEKKFYRSWNLLLIKFSTADTSNLALTGAYKNNLFLEKLEFSDFFGSNVLDFQKPQHVKYNQY